MGSTRVFPVRASDGEREAWGLAAAAAGGLSFNAWARRTLNEQVELDAAESPVVRPDDLSAFRGPDPRR